MPIYEYECSDCGHKFEVVQKMSERPKRKCESCGRLRARRLISQTNFVLKGTGWYTTDYAGKKAHGKDDGDRPQSASSGDGASAGEVAKSEPKTDEPAGKTTEAKAETEKKVGKKAEKKVEKKAEKKAS